MLPAAVGASTPTCVIAGDIVTSAHEEGRLHDVLGCSLVRVTNSNSEGKGFTSFHVENPRQKPGGND